MVTIGNHGERGSQLSASSERPALQCIAMKTHQAIDRRSLEMVRRIVAKIDADPDRRGFDYAKSVCRRWAEQGRRSAKEWLVILERPWEEVREILLEDSEEGRRLRQTDPFCGILTPIERWEIYKEAARREAS